MSSDDCSISLGSEDTWSTYEEEEEYVRASIKKDEEDYSDGDGDSDSSFSYSQDSDTY